MHINKYIDLQSDNKKNFQSDVLLPLLKEILNEETLTLEIMPEKMTKRKLD